MATPIITDIRDIIEENSITFARMGDPVVMVGTDFGATPGTLTVYYEDSVTSLETSIAIVPTLWSDTRLEFVVPIPPPPPPPATGYPPDDDVLEFEVTNLDPAASLRYVFSLITASPVVTSLDKVHGVEGNVVKITGMGFGYAAGIAHMQHDVTNIPVDFDILTGSFDSMDTPSVAEAQAAFPLDTITQVWYPDRVYAKVQPKACSGIMRIQTLDGEVSA